MKNKEFLSEYEFFVRKKNNTEQNLSKRIKNLSYSDYKLEVMKPYVGAQYRIRYK